MRLVVVAAAAAAAAGAILLLLLQIGQVCCTTSPLQLKPRIICNRQP
jgi:hypothetical protein